MSSGKLANAYQDKMQTDHINTLVNIQRLQQMEKDLYAKLEKDTSVPGNVGNYEDTIMKINDLAKTRLDLFKTLGNMYDYTQNNVANSRVDLVGQLTLTKTFEAELKQARNHLNEVNLLKTDKMRMVEINDYFGKRYKANSGVMKLIVYTCVVLLLATVLWKYYILPDFLYKPLSGVIIAIGLYLIIKESWDMYVRSNMNYDEYDFGEDDPSKLNPTIWEYNQKHLNLPSISNLLENIGIDCIGAQCCIDGMKYDETRNKCLLEKGNDAFENFVGADAGAADADADAADAGAADAGAGAAARRRLVSPFNAMSNCPYGKIY